MSIVSVGVAVTLPAIPSIRCKGSLGTSSSAQSVESDIPPFSPPHTLRCDPVRGGVPLSGTV